MRHVPPPAGDPDAPLTALIFDSYFDAYRGVVALIRVIDGSVRKGLKIRFMATDVVTDVEEVGVRRPANEPVDELGVGEVGYLITGLKDPALVKVGDTVTLAKHGATEQLPGYREVKPMVFTGPLPDRRRPVPRAARRARQAARSTTRRSSTSPSRATRSASASASASSACCTWRSSRSVSSASSTSSCSRRRRRSSTTRT